LKLFPKNIAQQLDFDHVQQSLSKLCSTTWAKEKALRLAPMEDRKALRTTLQETDELTAVLLSNENYPSAEYESLAGFLPKLQIKGHALREEQFADIRSTCSVYFSQYRHLKNKQERLPSLWERVRFHEPEKYVVEAIDEVLDERGNLRSNASPELAKIRKSLVKSRASADRIFNRMLKKYRDKGYLADFDQSVSENRRVLAIQSGYKGQVQGILHGSSSKQSISFFEPGETVEINNLIADLLDREQEEIKRILRALSAALSPYYRYLERCTHLLNHLDFIRAKALWSHREKCCLPQMLEHPAVELKDAFNPVLRHFNAQKEKPTVPLSVHLHPQKRILVISGPNAGGKSLSLKTVGLLQIMLQSGLLVPVHPASKMGLFTQLMGDIGDSQSIENELSTYSSKLQKMRHFLNAADEQSLLLLDEFGSGSDPELGSALAQVFLERLNSYQSLGIFTTHFNAIKALAAETPGVQNGAMLFDRKTFEPRYKLETGQPGSSYTFEVAQQSGIPKHLIESARGKVQQNTLQVDKLLVQIQDDKIRLEKIKERQNREVEKLNNLQAEQRQTIAKLEEKLSKQTKVNEANDRLLYWGGRFQKLIEAWMEQKTQKDKKAVVARFITMLNQRAGEVEKTESKSHQKQSKAHQQKVARYTQTPVKKGDEIKVLESGMTGTILEQQGSKYKIALGGNLSTLLEREKFVPASAPLGKKPKKKKRKKRFAPSASKKSPAGQSEKPEESTNKAKEKVAPNKGAGLKKKGKP
jgi:DNA mismatch repair protein MutS2